MFTRIPIFIFVGKATFRIISLIYTIIRSRFIQATSIHTNTRILGDIRRSDQRILNKKITEINLKFFSLK
jgi:hypothetical protein